MQNDDVRMYEFRRGVDQDNVKAYAWIDFVASQEISNHLRDELLVRMTDDAISEAQVLRRHLATEIRRN